MSRVLTRWGCSSPAFCPRVASSCCRAAVLASWLASCSTTCGAEGFDDEELAKSRGPHGVSLVAGLVLHHLTAVSEKVVEQAGLQQETTSTRSQMPRKDGRRANGRNASYRARPPP